MAVNDDIADALTSHSIGLQRLSNATVRDIERLLSDLDARIVERLSREDLTAINRARQERLLRDVRRMVESVYRDATGALHINLEALSEYERDYQLDMLRRVIPVDINWITPAADQIWAAVTARPFEGRLLSEWYEKLEADAQQRLTGAIRMGIAEQRTTAQMIRDVRGRRAQGFKDGIISANKRAAEAIVRTAVNHTATVSRSRLYDRNKRYIKGEQWLATLDARTSAPCRAADNRVMIGEGFGRSDFRKSTLFLKDLPGFTNKTRPPFHINCRSTTTPILRSFEEMGLKGPDLPATTRASMNGQVAADMNYSDWLRKQSRETQEDVLGTTKAALFRRGDLTLDRFINNKGEALTLSQLKAKERAAWGRAFKGSAPERKATPRKAFSGTWGDVPRGVSSATVDTYADGLIAKASRLPRAARADGLSDIVSASVEAQERFSMPPMQYIGETKFLPAGVRKQYERATKGTVMAYDMQNRVFIVKARSAAKRDFSGGDYSAQMKAIASKGGEDVAGRFAKVERHVWSVARNTREAAMHENGHRFHAENRAEVDAALAGVRSDGWGGLLSYYGASDDAEYMAEAFTLYMRGDKSQFFRIHPAILKLIQSKDLANV